jgi:hypothetical protein
MATANSNFGEETSKASNEDKKSAEDIHACDTSPLVYSQEMNQEIMRTLAEVTAMIRSKVGGLSPEQQAQFHALIEQNNLIEANGHLDS